MLRGGTRTLHISIIAHVSRAGSVLCRSWATPTTAGEELLDDLDHDLSVDDLSEVWNIPGIILDSYQKRYIRHYAIRALFMCQVFSILRLRDKTVRQSHAR